jgi:hypothetical protein
MAQSSILISPFMAIASDDTWRAHFAAPIDAMAAS